MGGGWSDLGRSGGRLEEEDVDRVMDGGAGKEEYHELL